MIFPNIDNIYAYYLHLQPNNEVTFNHWNDKIPEFLFDPGVEFFQLQVPTIDSVRYSFIIERLIVKNKNIYLTGASGTGKSVICRSILESL